MKLNKIHIPHFHINLAHWFWIFFQLFQACHILVISTTLSRDSSNKISSSLSMDEVLGILFLETEKKRRKWKYRDTGNLCPEQKHKTPSAMWWDRVLCGDSFHPAHLGNAAQGEAHQDCAGQAASTNTASLTRPAHRLTLQITCVELKGLAPSHTEQLPLHKAGQECSGTSLCTHWAL